jgi:hypothetical protein
MQRSVGIFFHLIQLALTFKAMALPSIELKEEIQSILGDSSQGAESKFSPHFANPSGKKDNGRYLLTNDCLEQNSPITVESNQHMNKKRDYSQFLPSGWVPETGSSHLGKRLKTIPKIGSKSHNRGDCMALVSKCFPVTPSCYLFNICQNSCGCWGVTSFQAGCNFM